MTDQDDRPNTAGEPPEHGTEHQVVLDRRSFRDALAAFPTGVTVITTKTAQGELIGITANSFSSVSLDPPLVLFGLARKAYSLPAFINAEFFAVSVLAADQTAISNRFATASPDKWRDFEHSLTESGCPVIPGALATFECRRHAHYDGGDHVILVGQVFRFARLATGEPLVFARGNYRELASNAQFPDYAGGEAKIAPPLTGFDPWTSG